MIRTFAAAALLLSASTVLAAPMGKGGLLVDDQGMTLYTFDKDEPGKSNCDAACLANWPAATVAAGEMAKGNLSILSRADGARQWAWQGKPLYRWAKDAKPGDMTGDGVRGAWHVVRLDDVPMPAQPGSSGY